MSNQPLCLPGLSCAFQSVPNIDGCCLNNPGGHFLQTQFWDPSPALGGNETWTVHGLWPDLCTGGFEQSCNSTRNKSPEEITHILTDASGTEDNEGTHPGLLQYMTKHWLSLDGRNSNLWAHEWNKHGTCVSTIEPECYARDQNKPNPPEQFPHNDILDYFTQTVLLYTTLPTFEFFARHGIVPSYEKTYELNNLLQAIRDSQHGRGVTIRCRNHNELSEIWYSFNARAELRNALDLWWDGNKMWNSWVPADPLHELTSNCPPNGIKYIPKDSMKPTPPSPTHTTTAETTTPTATQTNGPTAPPFTGKGRLMVKVISNPDFSSTGDGSAAPGPTRDALVHVAAGPTPSEYTGCLIRKGTWYAARSLSSCAIFTARDDVKARLDDDTNYHLFTLASRFAPCSFARLREHDLPARHSQAVLNNLVPDLSGMLFACSMDLTFQTILSNNATIDNQHLDTAKRLTVGEQHLYTFFAESEPQRNQQVRLWTDNGDGSRPVKVEVHWEGI